MARWLLDCLPLCGRPWRLGVATESEELGAALSLRQRVFVSEMGYRAGAGGGDLDRDGFDDWCDHLILMDTASGELIGTQRAIDGGEAVRRGGLYGGDQFDLGRLAPIAPRILQGSRTCVAAGHRNGPAIQYLSYGMELLLRERGALYFLGAESFRDPGAERLDKIHSFLLEFGTDPDWFAPAQPAAAVANLNPVPVSSSDERVVPSIIRMDLRMGFLACSPAAWDAEFGCYDVLMLGRRDRLTRIYGAFLDRIERNLPR